VPSITPARSALAVAAALLVGLVAPPAAATAAGPPGVPGAPGAAASSQGPEAPVTAAAHLGDDDVTVPATVLAAEGLDAGVSTRSAERAEAGITTTHVVDVVTVAATPGTGDDTVADVDRAAVERAVRALHDYWAEESGGAVDVRLGAVETLQLDRASCDAGDVSRTARERAHGGRYARWGWVGTDDHLLVLTREACGTQAFATVGGDGGEVFSSYGLGSALGVPVLLHEFGHNLGFGHAGSGLCRSTTSVDAPIRDYRYATTADGTAPCPVEEYGDLADIMGYSVTGAAPHLSTPHRVLAGWLDDVTTVQGAGTSSRVTLRPLDAAAGGRALVVVDPRSGARYHVEYRTASGRDATSAELAGHQPRCSAVGGGFTKCDLTTPRTTGGVRVLRVLETGGVVNTVAVAAGPVQGAPATTRDAHLDAGERFTSVDGGFTLTVSSLSAGGGAVLDVSLAGARPATATTTTLTLGAARQTHGGTPTTATAKVGTADGSPARGTVALLDAGRSIATATLDASGRGALAVPARLASGAHPLTASFTPADATQAGSTSPATTLTVDRAATTTTLAQSATRQVHGGSGVVLTVTVAPVAGTAPSGTVTFSRNGSAVASVPVTAGRASWTVPSGTPAGTWTYAAAFSPTDPSLLRSASGAVSVTVTKATSTTRAALPATTVARGTAPTVTVTVAAPGVPTPTGAVVVRSGTTTLATTTLRTTDAGRVTVTLPRQARAGAVPLVVTYAGTADVAGSAAPAVTLWVR